MLDACAMLCVGGHSAKAQIVTVAAMAKIKLSSRPQRPTRANDLCQDTCQLDTLSRPARTEAMACL